MCRLLGVSPSGYYAWCRRQPSDHQVADAWLAERLELLWKRSRKTAGAPRLQVRLRREYGVSVGRKRVARLMRRRGLAGCHRRRRVATTRRDQRQRPAPDLVARDFNPGEPNRLWTADITYVPTGQGWLYLAVVLDAFSRRVVGWSMSNRLIAKVVLDALNMAIWRRRPGRGLVHHSDQGSQYTSFAFGARMREAGIDASMGSVGDCFDNAVTEAFFATLETELIDRTSWPSRNAARVDLVDYIEGFYNADRLHSAADYYPPNEYEQRYHHGLIQPKKEPVH